MPEVHHKLLLLAMQAVKAALGLKSLLMQVETHVQMQMRIATSSLIPASTVHIVTRQETPSWYAASVGAGLAEEEAH